MSGQDKLSTRLGALKEAAPAGYAIALHLDFTTPRYLFQTYPASWRDVYSSEGLHMQDPTVHWAIQNDGSVDWSDLAEQDSAGVLARAAEYGLNHGVTVAVQDGNNPTLASFARSDRPFTDEERANLEQEVRDLHAMTRDVSSLDEATRDALHRLSILYTHS